jgi:predicted DCC family thiol-disulfide oxidoreductase YuxK
MSASTAAPEQPRETIFYDGGCGLCHALVRFTATRDRAGWFAFAPLGGEHFLASVAHPPASLPDSAVVQTVGGELLFRSAAVLHVLRQLGGAWRAAAAIVGVLPRAFLDWGYDVMARLRRKLLAPPTDTCPLVPPPLRNRFKP